MTLFSTMHAPDNAAGDDLGHRTVPKIRIAAFCETAEMHDAVVSAASDRRMMRATVMAEMGGPKSAMARYGNAPSPDLILLERRVPGDLLLEELGRLANVCDPETKVIVVGASNDISLYRALIDRGISDYLVGPVGAPALIGAISRLYEAADARSPGRTCAFIGAKGGVGSSTIAHNVAASLANRPENEVVLADMDLPFGTAGLNFNIDSDQGMANAIESGDKLDALLFERLLDQCADRLSMLKAPATLERPYDLREEDFDAVVDVARMNASHVVLDIPHLWSAWSRRMLTAADEVVVTAVPDLTNLRNTKTLLDTLRKARPHDAPPCVVLNQVGMSKRPEIKIAEFAKAIGIDPVTVIAFNPKMFGTAANNGQMIADIAARGAAPFATIAGRLQDSGTAGRKPKTAGFLSKLIMRRQPA